MKNGIENHPKTLRLARLLNESVPHICGHLHCLFSWAMNYAPQGNIGKHEDEDIAEGAMWEGEAKQFVDALVKVRFVDRDKTHRLLIHDWEEHAPDFLRKRLNRAKMDFFRPEGTPKKVAQDDTEGDGKTPPENGSCPPNGAERRTVDAERQTSAAHQEKRGEEKRREERARGRAPAPAAPPSAPRSGKKLPPWKHMLPAGTDIAETLATAIEACGKKPATPDEHERRVETLRSRMADPDAEGEVYRAVWWVLRGQDKETADLRAKVLRYPDAFGIREGDESDRVEQALRLMPEDWQTDEMTEELRRFELATTGPTRIDYGDGFGPETAEERADRQRREREEWEAKHAQN